MSDAACHFTKQCPFECPEPRCVLEVPRQTRVKLEKQKRVLDMYAKGFSAKDISLVTAIPLRTVYSYLDEVVNARV